MIENPIIAIFLDSVRSTYKCLKICAKEKRKWPVFKNPNYQLQKEQEIKFTSKVAAKNCHAKKKNSFSNPRK